MSETQKSIFITGAASGLGREVARYFANVGWFVGLADVNEKGIDETAALLPAGQWSRHRLDVTDRAQWKAAVADFAKHTNGHMTVLFNNAGIGSGGPIQDMTDEDIDKMIAICTNLEYADALQGTRSMHYTVVYYAYTVVPMCIIQ
jgi:NAD(P)-dependent dehydrogenase (short-subunit alcohol dehydrogenase family)